MFNKLLEVLAGNENYVYELGFIYFILILEYS